jgi:hypothetical protein
MKQFIRNILSHVKREQVKKKIKTSVSWDGDEYYPKIPILYTGGDFTLNVATTNERLVSTIYPNDKNIEIKASYDGDERRYQPISDTRYKDTWLRKLNGLYLQKGNHQRELWTRTKGIPDHPQKMLLLTQSDYDKGFTSQIIPIQEEVPKEYQHLRPYFNIIQITRIEIVEKELLLESVRPFRFVKDLRVPIFTETDRFIKIYYKYTDTENAQRLYEEHSKRLLAEVEFSYLTEGKE